MPLRKPLLPECFLHWIDLPDSGGEDVLRIASWRRNLTLKGKAFGEFQTKVMPLLTGKNTVEDICQQVAHVFGKDEVVAALDMLASQGIVIEGAGLQAEVAHPERVPQLGWLTENAPEGRAAQRRLDEAHVVIFGAGAHGAVVARSLAAAGIGRLTIVDPATVAPADQYFSGQFPPDQIGKNRAEVLVASLAPMAKGTDLAAHATNVTDPEAVAALIGDASLVLCCVESGEAGIAYAINIACRTLGISWIAASIEGGELVIGPGFFHSKNGPCYLCWRMREMAAAANPQTRFALETHLNQLGRDLSGRRENLAASADIVGGMLGAEALAVLSGASAPNLEARFVVITLPGLRCEKHSVLQKPGCPVCRGPVHEQ
jgi:adenylyltransferase/sulfurtransferase